MEEKPADKDDNKLIFQFEEHIHRVLEEAELNRKPNKFDEKHFEILDSSMKKNTSFVKKIKIFNDANLSSLLQEVDQLNLTNYLQEIALCLFEYKFKMTSVPYLTMILGKIHRNYSNFNLLLYTTLKEKLSNSISEIRKMIRNSPIESSENSTSNKELQTQLSNLVLIFYLFCELFVYEIVPAKKHNDFYTVVRSLLTMLFEHTQSNNLINLSLLVQLFKHIGMVYIGVIPRKLKQSLELKNKSTELPPYLSELIDYNVKKWINDEIHKYFDEFSNEYIEKSEKLYHMEQTNKQIISLRGGLSQEKKEVFDKLQKFHTKLKKNLDALADILDKDCPLFEAKTSNVSVVLDRLGEHIDVVLPEKDTDAFNLLLWDDTEIKSFYTDLPCVKFKNMQIQKISYFDFKKKMTQKRLQFIKNNINRFDKDSDFDEDDMDLLDYEKRNLTCVKENGISSNMMSYMTQLPNLVNRDLINNAAIEFLSSLFTKKNQKILIGVLHGRTKYVQLRLGLLPFFARLIAIISQVFPELGYEIVYLLYRDIRYQVRKKSPNNIEQKLKVVKYIGELTLFGICPKLETINIAKIFLADFYGHNIDMLCTLLDSCGRYLFVNHDSHEHTKQLLEVIIRKVKFSMMDKWQVSQLENICLSCNPVAALNYKNKKVRPTKDPILSYIKFILYTTLSRKTSHKNFQNLLQLPFKNYQVYWYLIKCFSRPWKFKFSLIDVVVSMVAALNTRKKHLVNALIDKTLETMTVFMGTCDYHHNQKLLCIMVYLGEFYNFGLINYNTLMQILYSIVSYKFSLENFQYICVDPDTNLIRIRMVCELIKVVFPMIDLNDEKRKELFCNFLYFFQCYYWDKKLANIYDDNQLYFPHTIDMIMEETFEFTGYVTPLYESGEEAKDAFERNFNTTLNSSTCYYQTNEVTHSLNETNDPQNSDATNFMDNGDLNPESFMEYEYDRLIQDRFNKHENIRNKKNVAINIPYAVVASSPATSSSLSSLSEIGSDNEYKVEALKSPIIAQPTSVIFNQPHSKDVKVKFVGRKNKKPISKEVLIPGNSFLASDIRHRRQIEIKEMKQIKNLVLNLEKLQTDDTRDINQVYKSKK